LKRKGEEREEKEEKEEKAKMNSDDKRRSCEVKYIFSFFFFSPSVKKIDACGLIYTHTHIVCACVKSWLSVVLTRQTSLFF
jgi:hypothetical protein